LVDYGTNHPKSVADLAMDRPLTALSRRKEANRCLSVCLHAATGVSSIYIDAYLKEHADELRGHAEVGSELKELCESVVEYGGLPDAQVLVLFQPPELELFDIKIIVEIGSKFVVANMSPPREGSYHPVTMTLVNFIIVIFFYLFVCLILSLRSTTTMSWFRTLQKCLSR